MNLDILFHMVFVHYVRCDQVIRDIYSGRIAECKGPVSDRAFKRFPDANTLSITKDCESCRALRNILDALEAMIEQIVRLHAVVVVNHLSDFTQIEVCSVISFF